MRTEKITAKAVEQVGGDRYKLSLVVSKRAEQLANGAEPLIKVGKENNKPVDVALRAVAEGKIGLEAIVDTE